MAKALHLAGRVVKYISERVSGRGESGQAITEYVALVAIFIGVTLMLIVLLDSFANYGWRILSLVGMDYP